MREREGLKETIRCFNIMDSMKVFLGELRKNV